MQITIKWFLKYTDYLANVGSVLNIFESSVLVCIGTVYETAVLVQ